MHQNVIAVGGTGLSAWELIGLAGTLLFSGRWVVQAIASHRAGTSVVSPLFWYMSISGNLLILAYFIFGRPDAVGIVSNSFPILLAGYNIWLIRQKAKAKIKGQ